MRTPPEQAAEVRSFDGHPFRHGYERADTAMVAVAGFSHPVSSEEARSRASLMVGLSDRAMAAQRRDWWDRLVCAATPEEKLTCERMIDALGVAIGLHQHERGAELSAVNRARAEAESRQASEDQALNRWR